MAAKAAIAEQKNLYLSDLRRVLLPTAGRQNGIDQNAPPAKPDTVIDLMIVNLGEMREYFLITQAQARQSFIFACSMSAMGFLLLAGAILLSLFYSQTVTPTVVSGISGVITAFLSATGFFIYSNTLKQMDRYYDSMHEDEQLLLAVHVANMMTADCRDKAYADIVDRLIGKEPK